MLNVYIGLFCQIILLSLKANRHGLDKKIIIIIFIQFYTVHNSWLLDCSSENILKQLLILVYQKANISFVLVLGSFSCLFSRDSTGKQL